MTLEKIRVLLADDHTLVRQGLRALLLAERDMEIVAESSTGEETIQLTQTHHPDVVVMDIGMPNINGIQATSLIRARSNGVKILILSMSNDEETVDQAVEAGISGYLVKDTVADELITAIRELKRGNAFFSPSISKILLDRKQYPDTPKPGDGLTTREKEILQLIAVGKSTKEIGPLLNISPKTVDNHRQQIMSKLNIHDLVSLTRYALSKGIVK